MANLKVATSTEVQIEKGVPLPVGNASRNAKYPWREMEVGDSFLLAKERTNTAAAYAAGRTASVRTGFKFTIRKTSEGYRCWRIA